MTDVAPEPPAVELTVPPIALPSTRGLVGASFELLARSTVDMRRASFYVGAIVLGTGGGYALATWALEVVSVHLTTTELDVALAGSVGGWFALLALIGGLGLFVAIVESRAMAIAILGGRAAGRPVAMPSALARSRACFWRVVLATLLGAVPVGGAQLAVAIILAASLPDAGELVLAATVAVAALVGAPLAYLLSGVVLGDVDPYESLRRSFRIFRARPAAAILVALFESISLLLILFGLSAGLDIALRVFTSLGLGVHSGTAGILVTTLMIVAGMFALGTLVFTVMAIAVAPQVAMFVGLTHATIGLDEVRAGGDAEAVRPGRRPSVRRFSAVMVVGFVGSLIGLVGVLLALPS